MARAEQLSGRMRHADATQQELSTAEGILLALSTRLDEPLSFELRRQLIEALVSSIRVVTVERDGKSQPEINVTYVFGATTTCAGIPTSSTGSSALPSPA